MVRTFVSYPLTSLTPKKFSEGLEREGCGYVSVVNSCNLSSPKIPLPTDHDLYFLHLGDLRDPIERITRLKEENPSSRIFLITPKRDLGNSLLVGLTNGILSSLNLQDKIREEISAGEIVEH